jgi:segregation and condensation protein B
VEKDQEIQASADETATPAEPALPEQDAAHEVDAGVDRGRAEADAEATADTVEGAEDLPDAAGRESVAERQAAADGPTDIEGLAPSGDPSAETADVIGEPVSAAADEGNADEDSADEGSESAGDESDFGRATADLKAIVEALIFASPEPLTPRALLKLLDTEPKEDVLSALEALKVDYQRPGGLQIVEVAGGYQIVTRPDLHEWVRRLFHERSTQKLSVQALETLAVIAYRQPITALEITEIRGVSASGVLNTLLERHLIKIVGRKQVVGRPFMYATTKEFLIRFGLKDLADLPKVEDMAESLGIDSPLLVEQMPPEEQLPLSEPDDAAALSAATGDSDGEPADEGDSSGEPIS